MVFHVLGGIFSTSRIFTMDLMLLKPYFHGRTMRTGAPSCGGRASPYIPTHNSASGCMASSSRNPSTYGKSMPACCASGMSLGL